MNETVVAALAAMQRQTLARQARPEATVHYTRPTTRALRPVVESIEY
ncbi:MAG TPA: hypothetical protein VM390_06655 [Acidimicrobiales bacterium]|nr:hypothetical protein [Acidimicrobiales bacterium]